MLRLDIDNPAQICHTYSLNYTSVYEVYQQKKLQC